MNRFYVFQCLFFGFLSLFLRYSCSSITVDILAGAIIPLYIYSYIYIGGKIHHFITTNRTKNVIIKHEPISSKLYLYIVLRRVHSNKKSRK